MLLKNGRKTRGRERMDAINAFVDAVIETEFNSLSSDCVSMTKYLIGDTIAVALAGSAADGVAAAVRMIDQSETGGPCSVVGHDRKVGAPAAAFLNSVMSHALDFDDTHDRAHLHCGCTVIPAALAVAEIRRPIDGRLFLSAVSVGTDMTARLGLACHRGPFDAGWVYTTIFGVMGATAACGKVLGLSKDELLNAFGIAYSQASGNGQCVRDGALSKRLQPAFAARDAVYATMLAKEGLTGARNVLEGDDGMMNQYVRGDYDRNILLGELGSRYEVSRLSFKPYPSCRINHVFIDAISRLKQRHRISTDDIASIWIDYNSTAVRCFQPEEIKQSPRTVVDAQFSVPYNVAVAVLYDDVGIDDFTLPAIQRQDVRDMAYKVHSREDVLLPTEEYMGRITVELVDGTRYEEKTVLPLGNPANPMSDERFFRKFEQCARHGVKPLTTSSIKALWSMMKSLDDVDDCTEMFMLM